MKFKEGFVEYRPSCPEEKFGIDTMECFLPETLYHIGRIRTDVSVVTLEQCGGVSEVRHVDVWETIGRAGNEQGVITRLVVQLSPSQYRLLMITSPTS